METEQQLPTGHAARAMRALTAHWDADFPVLVYARTCTAVADAVGRFRHDLDRVLRSIQVSEDRRAAIALVVSEAATNAAIHAYRDRATGPVAVRAFAGSGDLLLTVADAGVGPAPRTDSPGLGLGLEVIRASSDRLTVSPASPAGGTSVRVLFSGAVPMSDAAVRLARAGSARETSVRLRHSCDALRTSLGALREDSAVLLANIVPEAERAMARVDVLRRARTTVD